MLQLRLVENGTLVSSLLSSGDDAGMIARTPLVSSCDTAFVSVRMSLSLGLGIPNSKYIGLERTQSTYKRSRRGAPQYTGDGSPRECVAL